ncbi:MAG: hypothetical protein ABIX12_08495 [Rubrivivax sp.]
MTRLAQSSQRPGSERAPLSAFLAARGSLAMLALVGAAAAVLLAAPPTRAQGIDAQQPLLLGTATPSEAPQAPSGWNEVDHTLRSPWAQAVGPLRIRWGAQDVDAHGAIGRPVWGLGLDPSRRSTVYYEQGAVDPRAVDGQKGHRWGLEFRTKSTTAELRDIGTFRVQLGSSEGRVKLRPRKNAVYVAWQSNF